VKVTVRHDPKEGFRVGEKPDVLVGRDAGVDVEGFRLELSGNGTKSEKPVDERSEHVFLVVFVLLLFFCVALVTADVEPLTFVDVQLTHRPVPVEGRL
jgi:hypothetical protein